MNARRTIMAALRRVSTATDRLTAPVTKATLYKPTTKHAPVIF